MQLKGLENVGGEVKLSLGSQKIFFARSAREILHLKTQKIQTYITALDLSHSFGMFTRSSKRRANFQQFTCILNTFAGSLLYVCWIV